jgi:tRNA threonylcarbamoyladenosine biosynthesis protein TsaE
LTRTNHPFCFDSQAPEATARAARLLAHALGKEGAVISLNGVLGAGKTVFVKGLAEGLGLSGDEVSSPTFTLVNEYPLASGERLVHADFYRFESAAALEGVGFFDYLEVGTVLVAEWGDRFANVFPKDHLWLELRRQAPVAQPENNERDAAVDALRTLEARACGARSAALMQDWREALVRCSADDPELDCP